MLQGERYEPLLSKDRHTQTEEEELFFPQPGSMLSYNQNRLTPSTIDTAISAKEQTGRSVFSSCLSGIFRACSGCCQGIGRGCSAETSKSLLLAMFYLLGEVLLCIALIINWHTKTTGAVNIDEATVEILMVVYMSVGIIGMVVVFMKGDDSSFVIFTANEHQASKYLMSSVYAFGGGSLFMTVLYMFAFAHCREDNSILTYSLVRFIYTFVQMLFLQRFSLATFHRSCRLVFLMFHILGTNISIWIFYLIEETKLFSYEPVDIKHEECMNTSTVTHLASDWREYMTPFSMEFCLICAGLIYSIVSSMKHFPSGPSDITESPTVHARPQDNYSSLPGSLISRQSSVFGGLDDDEKAKAKWQRQVMSKRVEPYSGAHPGFLLGMAISVIMTVSALVIENAKDLQNSLFFHHIFLTVISVSQIIAMVVITHSLKHHEHVPRNFRSDDTLLVISLAGMFGWELLCIISSIGGFEKPRENEAIVILTHNVFNLTAALVQCMVIIRTLRFKNRFKSNKTHLLWNNEKIKSTMRNCSQAVIYLLMTNIGFWVLDSFFELKHNGDLYYPVGTQFYNKNWRLWSSLLYPLNIFFRFHSATLLFEIWVRFTSQTGSNDHEEAAPDLVRKSSLPSIDRLFFKKPEEKAAKRSKNLPERDPRDIYRKYWSK